MNCPSHSDLPLNIDASPSDESSQHFLSHYLQHPTDQHVLIPGTHPLPPPAENPNPTPLWIDILPLGARSKIAWYVSSGKQDKHMRNLALVSNYQKEAAVDALSHTFHTDAESCLFSSHWAHIFNRSVRCIITTFQYAFVGNYLGLEPLFLAPTLRELRFNSTDHFIMPFLPSCRLRTAVVEFKFVNSAPPISRIASVLNTHHLTIVCASKERCALHFLSELASYHHRFHSIGFRCICQHTGLWSLLRNIPNVTELSFAAEPPEDMYPYIRTVEKVELLRNRFSWDVIPHVARNVTKVAPCILSEPEQVFVLAQCTRLTEFECALERRAEIGFKDITQTLSSLRVLTLHWFRPNSCFRCRLRAPTDLHHIHFAVPGAILGLIQHTPNLVELHLNHVLLELDEQVAILKLLGGRLTKFSCTIKYDGKQRCGYLSGVSKALRQYNPRVSASNANTWLFTTGLPFVKMSMGCLPH